jgi:thiol-disulfide isomerase/thioredoxin
MNNTYIIAALAAVVLIGGGLYVSMMPSEPAMDGMEKKDAMMEKDGAMMEKKDDAMIVKLPEEAMMSAGSYEAYAPEKLAMADTGDVVLFFRASWCPTCKSVDTDIKKNVSQIPKGVTILDVDYDTATDLKKKYGVTYQHTFVQVAADGTQIAKWSASPTLAALLGNIK